MAVSIRSMKSHVATTFLGQAFQLFMLPLVKGLVKKYLLLITFSNKLTCFIFDRRLLSPPSNSVYKFYQQNFVYTTLNQLNIVKRISILKKKKKKRLHKTTPVTQYSHQSLCIHSTYSWSVCNKLSSLICQQHQNTPPYCSFILLLKLHNQVQLPHSIAKDRDVESLSNLSESNTVHKCKSVTARIATLVPKTAFFFS